MILANRVIQSPSKVLRQNYFEPSGLGIKTFAKLFGADPNHLRKVLKGAKMNASFIEKLSSFTNTSTTYWHYLQCDHSFSTFCMERASRKKISPIIAKPSSVKTIDGSPGKVLYEEFIMPSGRTVKEISATLKLTDNRLYRMFLGARVDHLLARKLSIAFGTSVRYWLELQTRFDIQLILQSERLSRQAAQALTSYCDANLTRDQQSAAKRFHPGKVLLNQFMKPSKIPLEHWSHLFCMRKKILSSVLAGRKELSLNFIVKLSKIFELGIEYWIDLQNGYYAGKAEQTALVLNKVKCISGLAQIQNQTPGQRLVSRYLIPMNWGLTEFANHLEVKPSRIQTLAQGQNSIDFDLAIRVGEALNMDPKYWIHLQLDYDLKQYEVRKSNTSSSRLNNPDRS